MTRFSVMASMPSPSGIGIDLGPFSLRVYGVAIAVGVSWRFGSRGGVGRSTKDERALIDAPWPSRGPT